MSEGGSTAAALAVPVGGPGDDQERATVANWVEIPRIPSTVPAGVPGAPAVAGSSPHHRSAVRFAFSVVARVLLVAVAAGWIVFLRPQALGGPVAYVEVVTSAMAPTVPYGNLAIAQRQPSYGVGDVVLYRRPAASGADKMAVARIVGGSGATGFVTKGDSTAGHDPFRPRLGDIVGKLWFQLPGPARWPLTLGFAALMVILVVLAWPATRRQSPAGPVRNPPDGAEGPRSRELVGAGAPR